MTRGSLRASSDESRFILRAELRRGDDIVISYAFDLTERSAFVATDWFADIGSEVSLVLSFPRLLDSVELAARVEGQCPPSGPGAPAGLRLGFEPNDTLTALVRRASDPNLPPLQACRILFVEDNG